MIMREDKTTEQPSAADALTQALKKGDPRTAGIILRKERDGIDPSPGESAIEGYRSRDAEVATLEQKVAKLREALEGIVSGPPSFAVIASKALAEVRTFSH